MDRKEPPSCRAVAGGTVDNVTAVTPRLGNIAVCEGARGPTEVHLSTAKLGSIQKMRSKRLFVSTGIANALSVKYG